MKYMDIELSDEISQKFAYWFENVKESERALLKGMSKEEIEDAFYKDIEFGTAGLRGITGLGTNRINTYIVIKVSQGIADYLAAQPVHTAHRNSERNKRICISYDCRNDSKDYALTAAKVFALNGIEAVLPTKLAPTPYLSYAVRRFNADMGVMITASHNTKEYNGYKVYGSDGCQLTDIESSKLKGFIDCVDAFKINSGALKTDVANTNNAGKRIKFSSIKAQYIDEIKNFLKQIPVCDKTNVEKLKVTYTPLNGTGGGYVLAALKFLNIKADIAKEQHKPDGNFETCPVPNPESESAYALAIKYAEKNGSDIILATDPDADRAGVMVKSENGYVRLTGNETGALLTEFLLRKIKKDNPFIIRTVVTTPLVDKIADKYGAKVEKVLTGFKYIGERISKIEKEGGLNGFVLGFEDSAGYLAANYARDKDGVLACALICMMAEEYKQNGKTLLDGLNDLYAEFGLHTNKTVSYKFSGVGGSKKIYDIMNTLRNGNAALFPDIKEKIDFMNPDNPVSKENNLPLTNMVALCCDDYTVYVRPSGTEPLIKVYVMAESSKAPLDEILKTCDGFFS